MNRLLHFTLALTSVLLSGCATAQLSTAVPAELTRLTEKQDCVCTLRFNHATRATECSSLVRFRIDAPSRYAGRGITLTFVQVPAVADPFPGLFSHSRFLFYLEQDDLTEPDHSLPREYIFPPTTLHPLDASASIRANQLTEPLSGAAQQDTP